MYIWLVTVNDKCIFVFVRICNKEMGHYIYLEELYDYFDSIGSFILNWMRVAASRVFIIIIIPF